MKPLLLKEAEHELCRFVFTWGFFLLFLAIFLFSVFSSTFSKRLISNPPLSLSLSRITPPSHPPQKSPSQSCSPTLLRFSLSSLLLQSLTHLDVTHNPLFQHLSTFFALSIPIERVQNREVEDGRCSAYQILISVWKKRSGSLTVYLSRSSSFPTKEVCDKRRAGTRPWVLQCLWRRWSASQCFSLANFISVTF